MVKPARPAPGSALRSAARAAFWTLTVLALPACLATTVAWFTSASAILAQLSPFRVQALALLAAHTLFCLALRRLRWAAVFAAFASFNLAVLIHATRPFAAPPPAPASASAPLKVLLANVLTSNTDPAPLLALVAAEKPDLIALLEINARWETRLLAALAADYPHHVARAREDNFGLAVFSRQPLLAHRVEFFADAEIPSIDCTLSLPPGALRVLVTHPPPPGSPPMTQLRDQHLGELMDWHRSVGNLPATHDTPPPILILGDLNSTPWCPPLRRLLAATGLRPAARDHGLVAATWPAPIPFLRIPLDHALIAPDIACPAYHVGPDIGSDHLPILLEIAPYPRRPHPPRAP